MLDVHDMESMFAVLEQLAEIDDASCFEVQALPAVRSLVSCDMVSLNRVDPVTHVVHTRVDPPGSHWDGSFELWAAFAHESSQVCRPLEVQRHLAVILSYQPLVAIATGHARHGLFSDRDRRVLELLCPHLKAAYQRALRFQSLVGLLLVEEHPTDISPRTLAKLGLTRREQEVVRLAALGGTDAEIAERLVVSVRTIESHLTHAYAKLGVTSRLAATARCLEAQRVETAGLA